MEVSFSIDNFVGKPQNLITVLSHLRYAGSYSFKQEEEVEAITCKTPSVAYKFARFVAKEGISARAEKVFLKNPSIGIRYLNLIKKNQFTDKEVHNKFWKKVVRKPEYALEYAMQFNKRLSESEEEVFVKSSYHMKVYAQKVIRGKFPEKIHNMIVLKSFEVSGNNLESRYLKDYMNYSAQFK
jgi:hypothetical protein